MNISFNHFHKLLSDPRFIVKYKHPDCTDVRECRFKQNLLKFFKGTNTLYVDADLWFLEEYNKVISYDEESGSFILRKKEYDMEETDEFEVVEGWGGYCETRPIIKVLDTWKLIPITFAFYARASTKDLIG